MAIESWPLRANVHVADDASEFDLSDVNSAIAGAYYLEQLDITSLDFRALSEVKSSVEFNFAAAGSITPET